ncbi:unnamed protein product [Closterium sp. Naga37s-1]|nr:unnamed protein product [Closterium sp. Naga37s-1]
MAVNNCPSKPHPQGQSCVLPWLGRFSFEPLNINPLFGPTALTLQEMGALNSNLVTNYHQGWRLVTAMWLHGGMVHLVCNLLGIAFLLNRLEKEFGLWRPTVIYLLSGVFAAVFSCLFLDTQISVGASGALFGLVGACLSELLINWKLYDNRFSALMTLLILIAINLAIGLMPYIDNFAHIGGCIAGFFLGFALLLKPQHGFIDLRDSSGVAAATAIAVAGRDPVTKEHSTCQVYTRILSGIIFMALFSLCMAVLFTKGNVAGDCTWCRYMSCVPTPWWTCDPNAPGTQGQGPVCQVRSYQNGTAVVVSLWHVDNAFHLLNNNLLPALLHLLEMGVLPRVPVPPRTAAASDRLSAAGDGSGAGGSDSWNSSSSGSGSDIGSGSGSGSSAGASYGGARSSGNGRSRKGLTGWHGSSSLGSSANRFLQRVQERLAETMEKHTSSGGGGSMKDRLLGQDRGVRKSGLLEGREGAEWGQDEEEGLRVCMLFYLGDERLNQYPSSAVAILWRIFQCRIRLSDTQGLSRRICFRHLAYGQRGAFPFYNSSSSLPGFDQFPAVIATYRSLAFSLFNIFPAARAVVPGPHGQSEARDGTPRRTLEFPSVGPLKAESSSLAVQGPKVASVGGKGQLVGNSGSEELSVMADAGSLTGAHMSDQHQQRKQQQQHASLPVPGIYSNGPIVVYFPRSSAFGDDRYITFIDPWVEAMGRNGFHCVVPCCDFSHEPVEKHLALFAAAHIMVGLHGAGLTNALYMSPGRLLVEWQDEFALGTGGKDRELLFHWVAKHSGLRYMVEDVRQLHVTGHGIVINREWATRSAARIVEEWRMLMLDT